MSNKHKVNDLTSHHDEFTHLVQSLNVLAKGGYETSGDDFFQQLVIQISLCLHVDYAFVGKLGNEETITTVAFCKEGKIEEPFTYTLVDTPCRHVIKGQFISLPQDVQQAFPDDEDFVEMEVQSYAGIHLNNTKGETIGILVVMGKSPFRKPELVELVIKIFSDRAAVELERQLTEEKLVETQENYRQLVENSPDGIIVHRDGVILYANSKLFELCGATKKEEVIGQQILAFIHPEDRDSVRARMVEVYQSGQVVFEDFSPFKIINLKGEKRFTEVKGSRVIYEGQPAIQTVVRDITERVETKKALEESEKQLRVLIDNMPDIVCFKDGEGRWIEANEYCLELFELKDIPYKGKTDQELGEYVPSMKADFYQCMASDHITWKHGRIYRIEEQINNKIFDVMKVPLTYDTGERKGLIIIARDITKRVIAERSVIENEQRYKSLVENNPDAILTIDKSGKIIHVNETTKIMSGIDLEVFLNNNVSGLFPTSPTYSQFIKAVNTSLKGKSVYLEMLTNHKDGHEMILNMKMVPIVVNKELSGIYIIAKDITEQKKQEDLIRKTEKFHLVGELAAGVAHEIRNPLTSLKGFMQILEAEIDGKDDYFKIILSELERINQIVNEFMVLAKPQTMKIEEANIEEMLSDVIQLINTQAALNNIELHCNFQFSQEKITCDRNQIKQVFINLIKNAIEAIQGKGVIEIKGYNDQEGCVVVEIIDNGIGISSSRLKTLGEPFYTTKEKGTGLGLMVTNKIIENHQGKISFSSKLNEGTNVKIILQNKISSFIGNGQ